MWPLTFYPLIHRFIYSARNVMRLFKLSISQIEIIGMNYTVLERMFGTERIDIKACQFLYHCN